MLLDDGPAVISPAGAEHSISCTSASDGLGAGLHLGNCHARAGSESKIRDCHQLFPGGTSRNFACCNFRPQNPCLLSTVRTRGLGRLGLRAGQRTMPQLSPSPSALFVRRPPFVIQHSPDVPIPQHLATVQQIRPPGCTINLALERRRKNVGDNALGLFAPVRQFGVFPYFFRTPFRRAP
jgi:hypothetical protein